MPPPAAISLPVEQFARIADGPFALGSREASVTIVEFADYECPYCADEASVLNQLVANHQQRIRLVYRDYPVGHAHSIELAAAARCAAEQAAFWPMHDYLFTHQHTLDTAHLGKYASQLGLDGEALEACVGSGRYAAAIAKDGALAMAAGATGTPAMFVNGKLLEGFRTYQELNEAVEAALAMPAPELLSSRGERAQKGVR